jgi:pimeloyl-ACP methyl ester carboxylesterase
MTDTRIFEPEGRAIPFAEEGEGPAIVLLPARGLHIDSLGMLGHSVAQEDFRVVRIGTRRAAAGDDVSLRDLARDVVDVMMHLDVEHAWVGGHALGGSVARLVAIDHHDRVNGVLLLGVEDDAGAAAVDDADAAAWLDAEADALQGAARAAQGALPALAEGIPVLVVQGSEDRVTPAANGEALRAAAPGLVSVVSVDGAGHLFPATHTVATSWAIEDYLDWD